MFLEVFVVAHVIAHVIAPVIALPSPLTNEAAQLEP